MLFIEQTSKKYVLLKLKSVKEKKMKKLLSVLLLASLCLAGAATSALASTGKIAFTSNRDGDYEIFLMNDDGSEKTNLTQHNAKDTHPAVSPDGQSIVFTSDRNSRADLYIMSIDGSNVRRLTYNITEWINGVYSCTWSPDGTNILFDAKQGRDFNIYKIDPDGNNLQLFLGDSNDLLFPVYNHSGTKVFYTKSTPYNGYTQDIYSVNSDGTGITRITSTATGRNDIGRNLHVETVVVDNMPMIIVTRGVSTDSARKWQLYLMNEDGTNPVQISNSNYSEFRAAAALNTDGIIAFERYGNGNNNIWKMNLNENNPVQLTTEMGIEASCWMATEPNINVDPTSYNFGDVFPGDPSSMFITISNTGGGDLVIDDMYFAYAIDYDPFTFTLPSSLPITVGADSQIEVEVTYNPSFLYYAQHNDLVIASNDSDEGVIEVAMSGTGSLNGDEPSDAVTGILTYIDFATTNNLIQGEGSGNSSEKKLDALINQVESAGDLIDNGDTTAACDQLESIYKKVDGAPQPKDFVSGEGVEGVALAITQLMTDLGCQQ